MHRGALIDYAERISGNRADAEDVVQNAWLQLKRAAEREKLRDPVPYLYRIVRNLAIDARRRTQRQSRLFVQEAPELLENVPDDAPSTERVASARGELQLLEQALAQLPERQRIAIEMYRLGGFTMREIGKRLDISQSLVHLEIKRGLAECHRICRQSASPEGN